MKEASWIEVSMTVDGEMAEAVAEVFGRFAPGGVAIQSTAVVSDPENEGGRAAGDLRVSGYLPVDAGLESAQRKLEEALWHLSRIRPLPPPEFRPVHEEDWAEVWKRHYRPVPVGERLVIVPAWLEKPAGSLVEIRIDPGMAFGTGMHPTTQLCLEVVENEIRPGEAVIDVGCGSGILSIAALKLGAGRALAVDTDLQAIEATRGNAALNEVEERLEAVQGSVAEILAGKFSIREAPLVLANILATVLIHMLEAGMGDLLAQDGVLVLSGILDEQAGEVIEAVERRHLRVVGRRQQGDWIALEVRR